MAASEKFRGGSWRVDCLMPQTMPAPATRRRRSALLRRGDLLEERFFLKEVIGSGGAGLVFEAIDVTCGETVVVKCMRPERTSKIAAKRLLREARSAAAIAGPHVVRVIHVGTHRGQPFLVHEHLCGVDLSELVKKHGPLPVAEACRYVREAALALSDAHVYGFVHRDVKPANLFLAETARGPRIKLLDFGLVQAPAFDSMAEASTALTTTGDILGSLRFMAPEQAICVKRVDERADVWALGATLYYLLTGSAPFASESLVHALTKVLYEPHLPIDHLRPDVPPELARIVDACLQKDPEDRWPSASMLAAAIASYAGVAATPPRTALAAALGRAWGRVSAGWRMLQSALSRPVPTQRTRSTT